MKIEKLIMAYEDMTEVLTLDPKIETDDKFNRWIYGGCKLLKTSDISKLKDREFP